MKILILGADGYLGRATAFYLSKNHEVFGADNYYKRNLLKRLQIKSLNDAPDMEQAFGFPVEGRNEIGYSFADDMYLDLLIKTFQPDAVIHYAEQPSAPYSMMGEDEGMETMLNNISISMRLVYALRKYKPDCHIIKLGSMGTYGTPNTPIPEGWFECEYKGRKERMLFPRKPHSIYHLSKVHDSDFLAFVTRMWGLRATDLHQGVVYGTGGETEDRMKPRFCYDDMFGTALNRFIVQAVAGIPLTVYGSGSQTRGWLNILDTLQCVELALENPAKEGEYRIFNQFTEQHSVMDIAKLVSHVTGAKIDHIPNPRKEKEYHFYQAEHSGLLDLGLTPHLLSAMDIEKMVFFAEQHKENIDADLILPTVTWEKGYVGHGE